jgi:hypothetical protein
MLKNSQDQIKDAVSSTDKEWLSQVKIWAVVGSSLTIILLGYFHHVLLNRVTQKGTIDDSITQLSVQVIGNIIPVLFISLCSFLLFQFVQDRRALTAQRDIANAVAEKVQSLSTVRSVDFFGLYEEVQWDAYFENSMKLDICGHFVNRWAQNQRPHIEQFFRRGGHMRIILPDTENEHILLTMITRYPNRTPSQIVEKITQTKTSIEEIYSYAGNNNAQLEVFYTTKCIWYPAFCFDDNLLVLSFYEMSRRVSIEAPAIVVDLSQTDITKHWFLKEFSSIMPIG